MKKLLFGFIAILLITCGCNENKKTVTSSSIDNDTVPESVVEVDSFDMKGLWRDSFMVNYRNKVHGYSVKAVVKMSCSGEFPVLAADLYFSKKGGKFILHSSSFGDTTFCNGRYDPDEINSNNFKKYCGKTIMADYKLNSDCEQTMLTGVPFFFKDLDFDNIPELVIVNSGMGVRFHDGYDIYRIVEGKPFLIDNLPYNQDREDWGFGMTDYPQFDFKSKTISCPYPEGPGGFGFKGCITYGISKKKKDVVKVNGRKHYFNKMVKIKDEKYKEN